MAAPSNLGFETAGAGDGDALGWVFSVIATAEEWASFAPTNFPTEGFGLGWDNDAYLFAFIPADLDPVQLDTLSVDPKLAEDFEELWDINQAFLTSLGDSVEPVPWVFDGFESWAAGYLFGLTDLDLFASAVETFAGWASGYQTTLDDGDLAAVVIHTAGFDAPAEDFEETTHWRGIIVDPATNRVVLAAHGFGDGFAIRFDVETLGSLPAGLNTLDTFHVTSATAGDFRVYKNDSGAPIDFTDSGVGAMYVRLADPYWVNMDSL